MRDEETEHDFKEGASFDNVIARYGFDFVETASARHNSNMFGSALAYSRL